MVSELIRFENRGRSTSIFVAGLDLSNGIKGISFDQSEENVSEPNVTVTIDIREMLRSLSKITPAQLEQAKETIKLYLAGYKRTVPEDGNSSMEVLR